MNEMLVLTPADVEIADDSKVNMLISCLSVAAFNTEWCVEVVFEGGKSFWGGGGGRKGLLGIMGFLCLLGVFWCVGEEGGGVDWLMVNCFFGG